MSISALFVYSQPSIITTSDFRGQQREVYEMVLVVSDSLIAAMRVGSSIRKLEDMALRVLEAGSPDIDFKRAVSDKDATAAQVHADARRGRLPGCASPPTVSPEGWTSRAAATTLGCSQRPKRALQSAIEEAGAEQGLMHRLRQSQIHRCRIMTRDLFPHFRAWIVTRLTTSERRRSAAIQEFAALDQKIKRFQFDADTLSLM